VSAQGDLSFFRTGAGTPSDSSLAAIFDGDLTLRSVTGSINVGSFNKIAALGNLTIDAPLGAILVSDLNAARSGASEGRLTLNAQSGVTVQTRAPADASGTLDGGVDWVANFLTLNAPSLTVSDPSLPFRVGLPDAGAGRISGSGAGLIPFGSLVAAFRDEPAREVARVDLAELDPVTSEVIGLFDAIAEGLGRIDPRLTPKNPLPLFLTRPSGGVNAAAAMERPVADTDWGSAFSECRVTDVACLEDTVGESRATAPETVRALTARDKVLAGSPREALAEAVEAYRKETGREPTGADFWQFCQSRPQARAVLLDLAEVVAALREVGARFGDPIESGIEQNLDDVKPEGIERSALLAAVEAAGASRQSN
jgi:hypothetical protein